MSPKNFLGQNSRGFSLPLVLILTGVLVVTTSAFLAELLSSSRAGFMMMKRKQAFYVADGLSRVVSRSAQTNLNEMEPGLRNTLLENPAALEQKLLDLVCSQGNGAFNSNTCCNTVTEQDENGCCTENMLPRFTQPLFAVHCLKIQTPEIQIAGSIPGGPFQGMQSDIVEMALEVTTVKRLTGQLPIGAGNISASSRTKQKIILGDVSPFQFTVFSYDDASIFYGPYLEMRGRTHINGDFCAGGNGVGDANQHINPLFNGGPYIEQLTVSGKIYLLGAAQCIPPPTFTSQLAISTDSSFSNFADLTYDSRDSNWASRSEADFNGNIRDQNHGIFDLQMPISLRRGNNQKIMHDGYNTLAGVTNIPPERYHASNNLLEDDSDENESGAFRLLIEPVYNHLNFEDPVDIKNQKLAHKADIRIINGIWFIRTQPRESENNWPGKPIWSDHPAKYKAKGPQLGSGTSSIGTEFGFLHQTKSYDVGQVDLMEDSSLNWNYVLPKRYSFYRWNPNSAMDPWDIIDPTAPLAPPAVISYGSLYRTQSSTSLVSTLWHPGFYAQDNVFCNVSSALKPYTLLDGTFTSSGINEPTAFCEIKGDLYQNRVFFDLLLGTRSGFQNPHAFVNTNPKIWNASLNSTTSNLQRASAVFPINFDVSAFQEALADSSTNGELGWAIANLIPEATFNGIIYIGGSWPGIYDDFLDANNHAHPRPNPLAYEENSAAPTSTKFPYPLCGKFDIELPTGGGATTLNRCAAAIETATSTQITNPTHLFPNALRIINARNIRNDHRTDTANNEYLPALSTGAKNHVNVEKLANGLTIASNLPIFLLGDFNRSSFPAAEENDEDSSQAWPACNELANAGLAQDCWISTSIAGDHITLLSNDWNDANSPLNSDASASYLNRSVSGTGVYNTSIFAGWNPSAQEGSAANNNGGIPNFPKFIETWTGGLLVSQKAHIRGSMAIGWASAYTPWSWSCCAPIYTEPHRQWRFDNRLNQTKNQPPGAPSLSIYSISQWVEGK